MYIILPQGNEDTLPHKYIIWGAYVNRWKKNGWEAQRAGEGRKKKDWCVTKGQFPCLLTSTVSQGCLSANHGPSLSPTLSPYLPGVCSDVLGSRPVEQSIAWENVHSVLTYGLRLTPYNTTSPGLRQKEFKGSYLRCFIAMLNQVVCFHNVNCDECNQVSVGLGSYPWAIFITWSYT